MKHLRLRGEAREHGPSLVKTELLTSGGRREGEGERKRRKGKSQLEG